MKDHEDPSSWIPIYSYGLGVFVCSRGSTPEPPEPPEPCGSRGSALLVRDHPDPPISRVRLVAPHQASV